MTDRINYTSFRHSVINRDEVTFSLFRFYFKEMPYSQINIKINKADHETLIKYDKKKYISL